MALPDVRVCSCVAAEACKSGDDCPSFKPICVFEDPASSQSGVCAECVHSLDCRGDLLCSPSTFTCEPGPKIINSRCGPEDDSIRSYEVDVPLYTGVSNEGYVSYEISKWPVYVSSIRFDVSSEQVNERLTQTRKAMVHLAREVNHYWGFAESSNRFEERKKEADASGLYTFVGGLTEDSKDLAGQVHVDAGSYFVDGTRTEYPAIGKSIIITKDNSSGILLELEDITRVRACIRRMDYDWQGNPMNPTAGRIRYEEEIVTRSLSSSSRSNDERYCDGYEKDGDPACPSGSKCVGKYYGATSGVTPSSDDLLNVKACSGAIFEDGKCQVGDIKLEGSGFKCHSAFGNPWSPVLPLCGKCEASTSACTSEVLSADAVIKSYPSAAKSVSPSGAQVSSETTVSNAGDIEQSTTVSLQFTSTQTNVVTVTNALANNIQTNLKISIPIPVLKPDGSITAGQTQTFTNQEAQTSTSTVQVSNTQTIKIPPKTKQTVVGKINTQNVRIEVPMTVKVQYSCGKEDEEIETTAVMTSDGTLLQGTTSFDISYGPSEPLL